LVGAGETTVADHVRDQDRSDFPGLAHGEPPPSWRLARKTGRGRLIAEGERNWILVAPTQEPIVSF
ncbi:MAG TPA: hypothetical protein VKG91_02860, partial [Roseiarcus sp.]|nr:hypothetical protein [Roseiarcus sp.]